MDFVVTHFARQPPEEDRWVILPFVSRRRGEVNGPYFFASSTKSQDFDAETIRDKEETGSIKRLSRSYSLRNDEAIWLTPDSDVYIASRTDPIGDSRKKRIAEEPRNWGQDGTGKRTPHLLAHELTHVVQQRGK